MNNQTEQSFLFRVKKCLRNAVEFCGLYYVVIDSRPYDLYVRSFYPAAYEKRFKEFAFYQRLLADSKSDVVFDIGANHGAKCRLFRRLVSRTICVEPDRRSCEILRERFRHCSNVQVIQAGAGNSCEIAKYKVFSAGSPLNTFSTKWQATLENEVQKRFEEVLQCVRTEEIQLITLDALIKKFGRPFYVKIDVEGYEWEVVRGLTQPVSLVSFECNLPEFHDETINVIKHLSALGPEAGFNYTLAEPPDKFASDVWMSSFQIEEIVTSKLHRFMEIYCRTALPSDERVEERL